jgi:hypothetical protein
LESFLQAVQPAAGGDCEVIDCAVKILVNYPPGAKARGSVSKWIDTIHARLNFPSQQRCAAHEVLRMHDLRQQHLTRDTTATSEVFSAMFSLSVTITFNCRAPFEYHRGCTTANVPRNAPHDSAVHLSDVQE